MKRTTPAYAYMHICITRKNFNDFTGLQSNPMISDGYKTCNVIFDVFFNGVIIHMHVI